MIRHPGAMRHSYWSVTWILVAGFLLQPLLAYLATPVLMSAEPGRHSATCMLRGMQMNGAEDGTELTEIQPPPDDGQCPALKLIQLAATSPRPALPEVCPVTRGMVCVAGVTTCPSCRHPAFSAYATRAPPAA